MTVKLTDIMETAKAEGYRGHELHTVIANRMFEISQNPGDWAMIAKYTGYDVGIN